MQGNIPQKYITLLKNDYGDNLVVEDDDTYELAETSEWYNDMKSKETPGGNLRFYRKLHTLTQSELGEKLHITKQKISNLENGIVPISRNMAYKLSEVFEVPARRFL
jgi:DNA-binding XRE family transcriptional regulator